MLSCVPTAVTAVMITTAIRAAIRPYSMAVAPDSSLKEVQQNHDRPRIECSNKIGSKNLQKLNLTTRFSL